MIRIVSLCRQPECAPILAQWAFDEWYRHRSIEFSIILKAYLQRTKDDLMPQMFVALDGLVPAGMVTLKLDDLWSRKDLNPWLSSLYVAPEYRRQGVGDALIQSILARAGDLQFNDVYLFLGNADQEGLKRYYVKRGWDIIDTAIDNDEEDTKILRYALPTHPAG